MYLLVFALFAVKTSKSLGSRMALPKKTWLASICWIWDSSPGTRWLSPFSVFYSANFLNIERQPNMTDISVFLRLCGRYLFIFGVSYCANFSNVRLQNGVNWKGMIDIPNFRAWDPVTGTCLNFTLSNKLLIDSWCRISKSVNHISDHAL